MIRYANRDDAEAIADIYRYYVLNAACTFEVTPPSAADMAGRIQKVTEKYPWLVYETSRVIGYAYASPYKEREAYRWSVSFSVYVDREHHGQGIGKQLYGELIAIVRALGYYNAYGGVTLPNEKSVRLHLAMGFREIGVYHNVGYKLGKWHSVWHSHLVLREHDADPKEPVAFGDWEGISLSNDPASARRR